MHVYKKRTGLYRARANLDRPVNLGVGNVYFLFFYVNVSKSLIL